MTKMIHQVSAMALALALPAAALAAPQTFPNSQRYAQKNPSAATGRSGSASLATRALLGKDGKTVVDVTTGTIGAATAPGYISKLQVKAFRDDETVAFTKNFSGMTTAIQSYTFEHFSRGQGLQLQGNVRGIDGKRTDVVTVTDTVRLRPDVAAAIEAPQKAKVNAIVGITGKIHEANGDVGATTDCVLYVDGAEADRANGVWVDAGDLVSCAFSYQFTTVGSHEIKVTAANVNPGDYDLTNNSATASIEIVSPETKLNYYMSAWEEKWYRSYKSYGQYSYSDGTYGQFQDWGYENLESYEQSGMYMSAWGNSAASFPLQLTTKESSDGSLLATRDITIASPDWSYNDGYSSQACASRYNDGLYFSMCSSTYGGQSYTNLWYQHYSGKAIYYSKNWSYYWDTNGNVYNNYYWSNNSSSTWGNGQTADYGATAKLELTMDSPAGTQTATAEATMSDWNDYYYWYWYGYNQPLTCSEYADGYGSTWKNCYEHQQYYKYRYGYASDYSQN